MYLPLLYIHSPENSIYTHKGQVAAITHIQYINYFHNYNENEVIANQQIENFFSLVICRKIVVERGAFR